MSASEPLRTDQPAGRGPRRARIPDGVTPARAPLEPLMSLVEETAAKQRLHLARQEGTSLADGLGADGVTGSSPWSTTTASRPVISVRDLHVTYRVSMERKATLKNSLIKKLRREGRSFREVNALRGVSVDMAHGKCTGIIGTNGAGKSTLMRAVAGILPPTSGRIDVYGRVSTLLALGVGFNSDLTGRENVVLGGLASGRSRDEIEHQFDEIADFAELGEFIDMPMRTYSSGMYSRLAFSVAVHMDPDILIIDEALSAGDARFKSKAKHKMQDLITRAGSMLLVSHSLSTIRDLSDEVLWMHKGQLVRRGDPDEVTKAYARFLDVGEDDTVAFEDF